MHREAIHILLIEDNPGDVRLLRVLMAETGIVHSMIHVDRLSTGLERLAEGGLDVVLLDLSLPDSQGLETLTRLHAQASNVPIVVLTGLEDETLGVTLVQAGAQDYLTKGQVTSHLLMRSVSYAIERKRAEETLWASEERFRQVVLSISDHIYVTELTEAGTFVNRYLSPHIETLTGYPQEKFIARDQGLEELENFGKMLGLDAGAVVGHIKLPLIVFFNTTHSYFPLRFIHKFDGIA